MPNWVINKLTIEGNNAEEIIKSHTTSLENGELLFDFETIDPMPKDLSIERGSRSFDGFKLHIAKINPLIPNLGTREDKLLPFDTFLRKIFGMFGRDCIDNIQRYILKPTEIEELKKKYNEDFDSVLELGEKAFTNKEKYGCTDWYDWRMCHWGTKWNACNTFIGMDNPHVVYFDTAWSPSVPIVEKFAKMHPELKITHEYAEEQIGLYCGKHEYENGEIVNRNDYKEFSKEAYELSFELWGGEELYRFDEKLNNYVYIDDDGNPNSEME